MVKSIQELSAELNLISFSKAYFFEKREIPYVVNIGTNAREKRWKSSEVQGQLLI
jgi:hypothetical protein